MTKHPILMLCGLSMLAGCAEEPPPRSVTEFAENPIMLEAAMVRCSQDRSKTRYDAECVNARQAVSRIQAKEEAEAKAALEARSESKRAALRRTQAAAAEARRRAAEQRRLREEAEYLAQFGVLPPSTDKTTGPLDEGNLPIAVVPEGDATVSEDEAYREPVESESIIATPPVPEEPAEDAEPAATDLESIRDELRRRAEDGSN
jgi:membrane-bound lytic murein transglycosylase